jgi:predicted phosphodiesterase
MKSLTLSFVILAATFLSTPVVFAQEWWFWPKYTLGQKADNYPGNRIDMPESKSNVVGTPSLPLTFFGEEPTERITNFTDSKNIPTQSFALELWLVNHVNQKIGSLVSYKSKYLQQEPIWLLGMYGNEMIYSLKTKESAFASVITEKMRDGGYKDYWIHLVANYDGDKMQLFINGKLVKEMKVGPSTIVPSEQFELEIASYMHHEPYMDLGNHVKMLKLYSSPLTETKIRERLTQLQKMVEEGKLFPDTFHFNAGPYLNNVTPTGIDIVWETDRPADFIIQYGKQLPLDKKVELNTQTIQKETIKNKSTIYKVSLKDLDPATPYFYNIVAMSHDGKTMESGTLTFTTNSTDMQSFSFGVIGDTEARPHINDRISKLLWDERPNFIVLVGDLTDGGVKDHKFEWNYEYFQGITQIASRVPLFPVPGNGEDDLYWYNQYHSLPKNDGFYAFKYGSAEFFMLDSNKPSEFAPGGKQYIWLEEKLKASTATWKFVCHHHAPYSADDDDYGDSWKEKHESGDLAIRKIVPLYEKYHVDMVFYGHLHTYQRTLPIRENRIDEKNGVVYVQGGGGGGNLEDFAPSRAWFSAKTYRGHHYFTVTVFGSTLNFKMYDAEGRLKDYLDLKK